jgi:cytochrome P450
VGQNIIRRKAVYGEMDLICEYSLPLPMTIITEILGVPIQDRDKFHKWSSSQISRALSRDAINSI